MEIEIIAIGEEIVSGAVVNTNGAFLSRALGLEGWKVVRQTAVSDDPDRLKRAVESALKESDLVITTGGLGPTLDDRTRETLCEIFQTELALNLEVLSRLKTRYGDHVSVEDQARVPRSAHIFPNPIGTASGLLFERGGKTLIALPGVPLEMQTLFTQEVLPYLRKRYASVQRYKEVIHFCLLTESMLDPFLRELQEKSPLLDIGIYPEYGQLTIVLASLHVEMVRAAKEQLVNLFPTHYFKGERIEMAIHAWMLEHCKTLALAESCTGGAMAARFTALAGASDYFLGSLVVYSAAWKQKLLGVHALDNGAVSEQTALEMCEGLFKTTKADYALALTGVAGPTGGSAECPVGTVYLAFGERGMRPQLIHSVFKGDRAKIIQLATTHSLASFYRFLAY